MRIHEIHSPIKKQNRKRVGRGDGSNRGNTATRGQKGQKSRSGGGVRPGFEGGQLPLVKRMPMQRGFKNRFKVKYSIVNLGQLSRLAPDTEVTPEVLQKQGLVRHLKYPVKILGTGEVSSSFTVSAHSFSRNAVRKITEAGGIVKEL